MIRLAYIFVLILCGVQAQTATQKEIIKQYAENCAQNHNYVFEMQQWQQCLDKGLAIDSTIAYLWQQKAMPYFKAGKYEVGMSFIDKAVQYNPKEMQPYRAFIKCIFAKQYTEAIADFTSCIEKYGNQYVMDHPFSFYVALSYLQLNRFTEAETLLQEYIDAQRVQGNNMVHHNALFYLGIAQFEQNKFDQALATFNEALAIYPNFSDVQYYKAICMWKKGDNAQVESLIKQARLNAEKGYTINEDNVIYERYPYQVRWKK